MYLIMQHYTQCKKKMELILWELTLREDTSSFLTHSYPFTPPPTHTFTSTHKPSPTHTFTSTHKPSPTHTFTSTHTPSPTHTFTHSHLHPLTPSPTHSAGFDGPGIQHSLIWLHTQYTCRKNIRVWDISMLNCNLRYFIGQCQHLYDIALFHWPVSTNTCMT